MEGEQTQQAIERQTVEERVNGPTASGTETECKRGKKEMPNHKDKVKTAATGQAKRRKVVESSSSDESGSDGEHDGASATTVEYIELSSDDMEVGSASQCQTKKKRVTTKNGR